MKTQKQQQGNSIVIKPQKKKKTNDNFNPFSTF